MTSRQCAGLSSSLAPRPLGRRPPCEPEGILQDVACHDDAVADVRPFTALRPLPQLAHKVAAPPYDVVEADEARAIIERAPDSFLRVTRPGRRPLRPRGRRGGAARAGRLRAAGAGAARRPRPRVAAGVLGVPAAGPQPGPDRHRGPRIGGRLRERRHPRARAHPPRQGGRAGAAHRRARRARRARRPLPPRQRRARRRRRRGRRGRARPGGDDPGRRLAHPLAGPGRRTPSGRVAKAFAGLDRLYVADGHHRSAAAARLAAARRGLARRGGGGGRRLPRRDLPGGRAHRPAVPPGRHRRPTATCSIASTRSATSSPWTRPSSPRTARAWAWAASSAGTGCATAASCRPRARSGGLAVSLLQERVLAPLLGVEDPRRDPRLAFVGWPGRARPSSTRGSTTGAREIAFALPATALADLVAVSDRGEIMPPKSTWFWPKPASGLLVHPLH